MQEYTTKGMVITEQIHTRNTEAGMVCLIHKNYKYHRVTLLHINNNHEWIVEGDYNGVYKGELYKLSVLNNDANPVSFPIGFSDWKYILKNHLIGHKEVEFLIKPKVFNPGKYVNSCYECKCTFLAAKRQLFCKTCCSSLATATVVKKENIKPVIYDYDFVYDLALTAFDKGKQTSKENFIKELTNIMKNGRNPIKDN